MLMFTLAISYLTTSNLPWFMDLTLLTSYAKLFFTTSVFTFMTRHIHNWVLFSLWLSLFILSWTISPLFSTSILGTYSPGEFIFQCHIFLPFHTVHVVLKAWIQKWLAIAISSGPSFVRTLHHDPSILCGPKWHGYSFFGLDKAVIHVVSLVSFLWLWFSFCIPSEG